MVKRRQPDLDFSTSVNYLKGKTSVTLRENKVTKKKQTGARSDALFVETAKDYLFGGKALRDLRSKAKKQTDTDTTQKGSRMSSVASEDNSIKSSTKSSRKNEFVSQNQGPAKKLSPAKRKSAKNKKSSASIAIPTDPPVVSVRNSNPGRSFAVAALSADHATPIRTCQVTMLDLDKRHSGQSKPQLSTKKKSRTKSTTQKSEKQPDKANSNTTSTVIAGRDDSTKYLKLTISDCSTLSNQKVTNSSPIVTMISQSSEIQHALKEIASSGPVNLNFQDDRMDSVEEDANQFQHVCSVDANSWLVTFTHRVEFRGLVSLTHIKGSVTVHGYHMKLGEAVNTYSPSGYFNSVVQNLNTADEPHCHKENDTWSEKVRQLVTSKSRVQLEKFLSAHDESAILLVESTRPTRLNASLRLLPDKAPEFPGFKELAPSVWISDCELSPRYNRNVISTVQSLLKQQKVDSLRLVVCGSKDIGKSTFIRYLTNRLLSVVGGVTLLDCDPGQTEFTPPGTVSLHSVSTPLLGPPWCNLPDRVDQMEYYGDISADADPDRYMSCIRNLTHEYRSNPKYSNQPLIVNTMGWRQGLGLEFLAGTVVLVEPTHLLQLGVGEASYRNFPLFSQLKVASHNLFIPKEIQATLTNTLKYEVISLLMDHVPYLVYSRDLLKAPLLRELMMASYFTRNSPVQSVHSITPYRVKFSKVAVHIPATTLPIRHIAAAINGQVVALCSVNQEQLKRADEEDNFLSIVPPVPDLREFYGYGLIRAIDPEEKLLYVTTPLSAVSLSSCNLVTLVTGVVTPNHFYLQQLGQVRDGQPLPYFGDKKGGVGTSAVGMAVQQFRRKRT